jgi:tetratricopeptide (TPR) repeat protein
LLDGDQQPEVQMSVPLKIRLPKAPTKIRKAMVLLMLALLPAYFLSMWIDYPFNGNPITWLTAKEAYIDGNDRRSCYRLESARKDFEKAVSIYPGDARFQYALGETLERLEDYTAAQAAFGRAVEIKPRYIDAWLHKAAVELALQKKADAIADSKRALAIEPRNCEAQAQLALMICSDDQVQSEKLLTDANKSSGEKNARFWFLSGQCYEMLNKPEEAENALLQAARLDRYNPEFSEVLAIWFADNNKKNQSVFWFKHAAKMGYSSPVYQENYGLALMRVGNLDLALAPLKEAMHRQPDNMSYRKNYASLMFARRDYAATRALLQPQIEAGTVDPALWNIFVNALIHQKKIGDSKDFLEKLAARSHGQTPAIANRYIGDICWLQGKNDASKQAYEQALGLNPTPELKTYIEQRLEALTTSHRSQPTKQS